MTNYKPSDMVIIDGMTERVERITEFDINSFEADLENYYSEMDGI